MEVSLAQTSGVPASPLLCVQDVRRTTERDMWVVVAFSAYASRSWLSFAASRLSLCY